MIKYIGSKRVLVPTITAIVRSLAASAGLDRNAANPPTVVDFFSGTSRVGHALKRAGCRVIANDLMTYAHTLAACYVQADRERVLADAEKLIAGFNAMPGSPGYVTETFCEQSRFFQPRNGERIDAIREAIERKGLEPELKAVCLVSLMEAADRVDSTTGVQMAYLKKWAARSHNDLNMRVPDVLPGAGQPCEAHNLESRDAARRLTGDVAYIDPPYNQHTYIGNYHIWESLVKWDKPEVYGVACKRVDCRERKSDYNSKRKAESALGEFLQLVDCPRLVVSFSDEGYISREAMESLLAEHGTVHVLARDHKRYVGAQIGIYNPSGRIVGEVSHLRNTEYIYVVVPAGDPWSPKAIGVPAEPGRATG